MGEDDWNRLNLWQSVKGVLNREEKLCSTKIIVKRKSRAKDPKLVIFLFLDISFFSNLVSIY